MTFEDPNTAQFGPPGYLPPPPLPVYPAATYPGQAAYPGQPTYPGQPMYPGQPVYGYPMPGYPGYPADPNRCPDLATASAVLAYVEAGLLIFAGILLFVGASATNNFADVNSDNDVTTKFVLLGLANIVAGILYLTGGLQVTNRQRVGRTLLLLATAIVILLGLIWLTWAGSVAVFWALLYWALGLVGAGLLLGSSVSRWLAGRDSWVAGPPTAQYPTY